MKTLINSLAAASLLTSGIAFAAEAGDSGGAPTPPVTETKTVIKQNGIKRPDSDSITGKLWDIADAISEGKGAPATRKEVVDRYMAEVLGANQATANTQYARWVTFHGVSEILRAQREQETVARREAAEAEKAAAKKAAEEKKAKDAADAEAAKLAKEAEKTRKAEEKEAAKKAAAAEREAAKQRKADEKAAAEAAKQQQEQTAQ